LGPNGAGTTTTLKMMLGLAKPTDGTFSIMGRPADAAARAELGFLPEQPYFSPQLTATQALVLYGRLSGLSKRDTIARMPDLLERVGLAGRERMVLSKFSRGMLQRLGVAQAILANPAVVVLDEPASGLDPVGQRDMRNLMLELRDAGTSILLSSHQLSEIETVCDQVTILNKGRVAARGHIDDLLNVVGRTSVRASGGDKLPDSLTELVGDIAVSGASWVFSIADGEVRRVVDVLDDEGWRLLSIAPMRDSLEDYFARLVGGEGTGVAS
ncbi:MAG: ABC transporter ATP-binding protein, partial [Actinomycetota bacterium]|nr:ABC transporter ATP-binding protein [Actinomycetota bacterium]